LCAEPKARAFLEDKEMWYRYATTNSTADMADVVWFFMNTYFPEKTLVEHSGRYQNIFIKESEPDKLVWVP